MSEIAHTPEWLSKIIEDATIPNNHAVIGGRLICFHESRVIDLSRKLNEAEQEIAYLNSRLNGVST